MELYFNLKAVEVLIILKLNNLNANENKIITKIKSLNRKKIEAKK